jgi:flagellar biogenesis protein FliO
MTLDLSALGILLISALVGFVGWTVKRIVADVKSLEKDHAQFKTHVAENYVEKDDLHRHLTDIKDMLKRLFEKVDKK